MTATARVIGSGDVSTVLVCDDSELDARAAVLEFQAQAPGVVFGPVCERFWGYGAVGAGPTDEIEMAAFLLGA